MDASEKRTGSLALLALGAVAALACVSAIAAATTLVVLAWDDSVRHGTPLVMQAQADRAR
jgi:spermidine/putrescine-binding protein